MASIYSNFRVTHVEFEVQIIVPSGGPMYDVIGVLIGILPNGSTYPASGDTIDRWAEVPGVLAHTLTGQGGVASTFKIRQRVAIAAIEGLNPAQLEASPNYASFAGGAVAYGPELLIGVSNESATTARGVTMHIRASFTCEFWDRKQLAQS